MTLQPIAGATGVEVAFTPSRTTLCDIECPVELSGAHALVRTIGRGPSFRLGWGSPLQGGESIPITISYWGEPPRAPQCQWETGLDDSVAAPGQSHWQTIYQERERLSRTYPEQAYLFELERNTLDVLLPFYPELTTQEREESLQLVGSLLELLQRRLKERHAGLSMSNAAGDRPLIHFNHVFEASAAHLGNDLSTEGRLLERFAGGLLRWEVLTPESSAPEIVGEPDSFFVFLFAEFGLLCLDRDVAANRWHPLLKSLIKMQSLYLARFARVPRGNWRVTHYKQPPQHPVAEDAWRAIDADYAGISTRNELERKFFTNLHDASNCY